MRFEDYLSIEQKQQLNKMVSTSKPKNNKDLRKSKPTPKKQEKVNWDEIMGTKNRGLKRKKGGAWSN